MSIELTIIAVASLCGGLGAVAYVFAYLVRRGAFRPLQVAALCLNLFALVQLVMAVGNPRSNVNLLFALGCVGVSTLAMSLSSIQRRRARAD